MTYESMMAFAESWIAAWNRRDVEAVLAHYSEDAQFVSLVARNLIGRSILQNKKELGRILAYCPRTYFVVRVQARSRRMG